MHCSEAIKKLPEDGRHKEEIRLKMTAKKTSKDFVEKSGEGGEDKFIERIA